MSMCSSRTQAEEEPEESEPASASDAAEMADGDDDDGAATAQRASGAIAVSRTLHTRIYEEQI